MAMVPRVMTMIQALQNSGKESPHKLFMCFYLPYHVEAVEASGPGYFVRLIGGLFWVTGMLIMAFNVYQTVKRREAVSQQPAPQAA